MIQKNLMLLISLLFASNIYTQTVENKNIFPDSWLGNYKGKMYILSALRDKVDTVDVEFQFSTIDVKNRWTYKMTYRSKKYGEMVKDYELVKPDSLPKNTYLMDEKDGILIQNTLMGNTLYSNFIVSGSLLCYILRKESDGLFLEIFTSKDQFTLSTQSIATDTEESFIVDSYPPYTTQFAHLRKEKVDSQSGK